MAQQRSSATSAVPDDVEMKPLLDKIENALMNSPAIDQNVMRMLIDVQNMVPNLSAEGEQSLRDFAVKLQKLAEQNEGDRLKWMNLSIVAGILGDIPVNPVQQTPTATNPSPVTNSSQGLIQRGEAMLQLNDVVAARLLFARAAETDGSAAFRVAETYDPRYLTAFRGVKGDVSEAEKWYRKAAALGETGAAERLKALEAGKN